MVTNNLQQRSKTGSITPADGGGSKFSFQLPLLLGPNGLPDPGAHTVQFSVEDPNNALNLGSQIKIRAEILWKISGNDVRRVVDVGNGVSVSGQAEGVSVLVYDDSEIAGGTIQAVTVGITVAKGTRPSVEKPPTYTIPQVSVGPAADTEVVVVPNNIGANSVMVSINPDTIGAAIGAYDILAIQCQRDDGTSVLIGYDPRQDQWVPLVAGARSILLQTSAAAPLIDATVVFGIDG